MKEKRLQRRWARVSIVLVISGAGCTLFGWLMGRVVYPLEAADRLTFLGLALVAAALTIQLTSMRCPYCGKGKTLPRWNPGKRYYCAFCGKPFLFDDEPDEIEKEQTKEE